jgi:UDP-N-acetylmuramate dehydrogenase
MNEGQKQKLTSLLTQPIEWDAQLARYTSISIGGPAEALVRVTDISELQKLLLFLNQEAICWRIIGRGTNILVNDNGYRGVIVLLDQQFISITQSETGEDNFIRLSVGAGCSFARLLKHCIEKGLTGLEFGFGIPGSLGGAVVMNAGAWGEEISSVIHRVRLVTHKSIVTLGRKDLTFTYRKWDDFTKFQGSGVVAEIELNLLKGNAQDVRSKCMELHRKRKSGQPHEYPNAGSFFKNPPGESAGRLIDECGLKGKTVGDAMVSPKHGNFLVNKGRASAADVKCLMNLVQKRVRRERGVELVPEVHFI